MYVNAKDFVIFFVQYIAWHTTREAIDKSNKDITPTYYIAIEQDLGIECSTLTKALFCLLAIHYVFDISYHDRVKDFFSLPSRGYGDCK